MNIAVIGTGYVGLVTGALLAGRGNRVTCVDINEKVIAQLEAGKIHIYEPGLENIVKSCVEKKLLSFTTNITEAVKDADMIFIGVGTPSDEDGTFNLTYVKSAAQDIGKAIKNTSGFKVVVMKSTVPQGTNEVISKIIDDEIAGGTCTWAYVSNPETLAEGTAVRDFSKPDRIIIGTESDEAFAMMSELYHPFVLKQDRILRGSPADAELAKLFSNTALATRIAMVNEFSRVADVTSGADMDIIRKMVCSDNRIGYNFMFPSPGYGGSCFPKDIQGVVSKSKESGYEPMLLSTIHESNEAHKKYVAEKVCAKVSAGESVCLWGVTFKPNTDDMRDAASVVIVDALVAKGVQVRAYDPQNSKAKEIFGEKVEFINDAYTAVRGCDALVLVTEWSEFDSPNFSRLAKEMKGKTLFDLRNRWMPEAATSKGFKYYGIGREY
jgi:UDPglucose 6-dehydrogenase